MLGKNVKKLLALLLALAMVFTLCACNGTDSGDPDQDDKDNQDDSGISAVDPSTMTEKEYMLLIEKHSIEGAVGALMDVLGAAGSTSTIPESFAADVDLGVRFGDEMLELLQGYLPEGSFDISALEKIGMEMDVNAQKDLYQMVIGLGINDKKLADVDLIMDMAAMTIWLGLPGLSEQYVKVEIEDIFQDVPALPNVNDKVTVSPDYGEFSRATVEATPNYGYGMPVWMSVIPQILPDPEKLEPLLNKYIGIMLENIQNVKRENVQLEMDGAKQDAVVMTYTITQEDLANMLLAVMKAAKDDTQVKALVDELGTELNAIAAEHGQSDPVDLWAELKSFLEEGIAYFEEYDEYNEGNYIVITTSLNKKNAVIGRSVTVATDNDDTMSLTYLTVTDEQVSNFDLRLTSYAYSASMRPGDSEPNYEKFKNEIILQGHSDLVDGAAVSGSYTLRMADDEDQWDIVTVEFEDMSETTGTVTIEPSAELMRRLFGADAAALDFALRLKVQGDAVAIDLLLNDELLIGLDLSASQKTAGQIQKPTNAVDINSVGMQTIIDSIDLETLVERWNSTGMPQITLPE